MHNIDQPSKDLNLSIPGKKTIQEPNAVCGLISPRECPQIKWLLAVVLGTVHVIVHRTFGLEVLQLILASKLRELEQLENFSANNH